MTIAQHQLRLIISAFQDMHIPLADEKIEGPSTYITYLGIAINSHNMTIEITSTKYNDCTTLLNSWAQKRTCTKRQLKSLIGKLGSIYKIVRPGRMFSRRLIDLTTTVKCLYHHITLNREARADIQWWRDFLPSWTAQSLISQSNKIRTTDMRLYTDASDIGYGAIYDN